MNYAVLSRVSNETIIASCKYPGTANSYAFYGKYKDKKLHGMRVIRIKKKKKLWCFFFSNIRCEKQFSFFKFDFF